MTTEMTDEIATEIADEMATEIIWIKQPSALQTL